MTSLDANIVIWLNGLSGNVKIFDDLMRLAASDYLMPLVFSLGMLGLWFSGKTPAERVKYQLTMLMGISALSIANVVVWLFNIWLERPRPFVEHGDELNLLFYPPTDPSFPANPVAVGFAAATAACTINRKFGWWLYAAATLFGFSRLYAGVFYPTDIVGGAIVGIAIYGFTTYLRRFLEPLITSFVRLMRGLSAA
ncbi:phosphatase PAP2 family protein [Candidatus Lucifugimonas marina]|uniref:Phosphatase PAP2 family protein n=1 Tax=Candidatus Lucifugimonas marina TaxID=3038979 RepID=A0AAJ6CVF4_9CHLR|nr:phosphatase PAP2 family protein [SAR202 cluster bacterium JH702]MDG0870254.1 phosphatase PAP2 family protein [SAR202 cluster bacterium JH639]WFG36183.1 phosphatase PAP2 family protein [SAR202 cluster bacterium JH545]WFG40129.1 phosphatase PAP2 family protein [SAR202 cluster bacterium JH1073]